jgi:nucleoside-diphosphate-sugar epimerase
VQLERSELVVVAGAGGFIGGHLIAELLKRGFERIRSVDVKPFEEWYQLFPEADNRVLDLRLKEACEEASEGGSAVFNLAADMGGMGFIENNKALCMLSVLINTHMLQASLVAGAKNFMFASSACVYAADKQCNTNVIALREEDAYPAEPEDGYGWEKLFGERMCRHFMEDFGIEAHLPRFHNVYGTHGTYDGGREKAPAAVCRKVAHACISGDHSIEIWGDGEQTRSFTYIDDAIDGTLRIMESGVVDPINIGSSQVVTINQLVDMVEEIAGVKVERRYDLSAPQGVRGRNSDNTLIEERLGWSPSIRLEDGLEQTYRWVYDQMTSGERERSPVFTT